jgi:hypothetical protein
MGRAGTPATDETREHAQAAGELPNPHDDGEGWPTPIWSVRPGDLAETRFDVRAVLGGHTPDRPPSRADRESASRMPNGYRTLQRSWRRLLLFDCCDRLASAAETAAFRVGWCLLVVWKQLIVCEVVRRSASHACRANRDALCIDQTPVRREEQVSGNVARLLDRAATSAASPRGCESALASEQRIFGYRSAQGRSRQSERESVIE